MFAIIFLQKAYVLLPNQEGGNSRLAFSSMKSFFDSFFYSSNARVIFSWFPGIWRENNSFSTSGQKNLIFVFSKFNEKAKIFIPS